MTITKSGLISAKRIRVVAVGRRMSPTGGKRAHRETTRFREADQGCSRGSAYVATRGKEGASGNDSLPRSGSGCSRGSAYVATGGKRAHRETTRFREADQGCSRGSAYVVTPESKTHRDSTPKELWNLRAWWGGRRLLLRPRAGTTPAE